MSYYDTIDEDLARAREILTRGFDGTLTASGHIYGADTYAAYKLLESFVQEVERLTRVLKHEGIEHSECQEALVKAQADIEYNAGLVLERDARIGALLDELRAAIEGKRAAESQLAETDLAYAQLIKKVERHG
jgi:hypothetical protein